MQAATEGMKISYIIFVSFFLILLLFSITTYINYQQAVLVRENNEALDRSSQVVRQSNRFQRNFLYMTNGLRVYLLSDEQFFVQAYDSAIHDNKAILRELSDVVEPGSEQRILLDDIKELQNYWIAEFAEPLLKARINAVDDSAKKAFDRLYHDKLVNGLEKDVQRSLNRKFSSFINEEYENRDSRKDKLTASILSTERTTLHLTIFSIVTGVFIALGISHYLSSRIVKMVRMSQSIARGQYDVQIADHGNSELSQLAKALNHMARILDKNISLLKRQKEDLDQFAHMVSHDLKAPLRGIDNVVTWIEEDHSFDLPPKVNDYLRIIKGRIMRAENLLRGVLLYARIGQEIKTKTLVNIRELLEEVQEYIPSRPGIALLIDPDLPTIVTERLPLIQIFTNLISNAVKHHDKPRGTVRVYHQALENHYVFFVSDDGPGIDPQYHDRIFQLFQTLQEGDSFESTGIGLAIVKKIIDDRKLTLTVTSEMGKGSTFSFTWPK